MKRRREQERDEAIAREQADARQESLLAELKARQTGAPVDEPPPAEPEPPPAGVEPPPAGAEPPPTGAEPPPAEGEVDEPEPATTDESPDADEGSSAPVR